MAQYVFTALKSKGNKKFWEESIAEQYLLLASTVILGFGFVLRTIEPIAYFPSITYSVQKTRQVRVYQAASLQRSGEGMAIQTAKFHKPLFII
jgi:predicted acetyltransferase